METKIGGLSVRVDIACAASASQAHRFQWQQSAPRHTQDTGGIGLGEGCRAGGIRVEPAGFALSRISCWPVVAATGNFAPRG